MNGRSSRTRRGAWSRVEASAAGLKRLAASTRRNQGRSKLPLALILAMLIFLLAVGAASAFADDGNQSEQLQLPASDFGQLLSEPSTEMLGSTTDPEAAEQLPHQGLDRGEAVNLLQSVFGEQLESPAGLFNELEVQKFYSDHVAVVESDRPPEAGETGPPHNLLESLLPLRTEDSSGHDAQVDLELEDVDGELQPVNPLVEVGIPAQLGEGISLPESEIEIHLSGAPADRSPSTVIESTAVYPNVDTDTDLTVAPTPAGVETLTQLRSPAAPQAETFDLTLPEGASLHEVAGGRRSPKAKARSPKFRRRRQSTRPANRSRSRWKRLATHS